MKSSSKSSTKLANIKQAPAAATPCVTDPAQWFVGLSANAKSKVCWVAVDGLKDHAACNFLPFSPKTDAMILKSVKENGVLCPLAVGRDGAVLDGRYRLRAAKALGLKIVPVIVVDVDGEDAVRWVYLVKQDREHLSEADRAILAVQYQKQLSAEYVKIRAAKATQARLTGKSPKRNSAQLKCDSRQEACDLHQIPVRTFNQYKNLSNKRSDLFEQVMSGTLEPLAAFKRMGRNIDIARVEKAKALPAVIVATDQHQLENNIHCGDAVEVMRRVPDGLASLVMYSPPYHGVPIEYYPPLPKQSYQQYLDYQRHLLVESYRAVCSGGRLAIILDTVRNKDASLKHHMLPVVAQMTLLAIECGWLYLDDISWCKDEITGAKTNFGSLGLCSAPSLARNHETILLFYKEKYKLDGDPAMSDLSREEHLEWRTTEWRIKPEVDKTRRLLHPAPLPEEIPRRLITMFTYRNGLVIDPYNGSGTTTAVAKRQGRRFIGIDQSAVYCSQARERMSNEMPAITPELVLDRDILVC